MTNRSAVLREGIAEHKRLAITVEARVKKLHTLPGDDYNPARLESEEDLLRIIRNLIAEEEAELKGLIDATT